ncbi:ComF family protein [Sphingomonas sabuli]|uniref:ComF family protein n=1 Tax=Sphingomonas sabuli TaxID=2764186 RepID=A0A7G9L232_9SPHN|nr:ComF family protein [Sphingomonas sabuli]QNM82681.1 ComF family protein [Sphingomonas sabuli]
MQLDRAAQTVLRSLLDFALPPRCSGCGVIVNEVDSFCPPCWTKLEFLGPGGCQHCGIPLNATDAETCAACLAKPPRLDRIRAAVAYGDISSSIAMRLKYGRKIALARTMSRYMRPHLAGLPDDAVLVPIPLHRARLWSRSFNQSAFVARALARQTGLPVEVDALRRVRATPPLRGMGTRERRRTVAGAFRARPGADLRGRTIILVDDVYTSGSTANACARVLKRAGAARVDLVSWARVIRPAQVT